MATQSTGGGTVTSFNNTPQAQDDLFNGVEDKVEEFDVMSNDLGGNAKILWSIDNSSTDGSADLLTRDAACIAEYSELGARIWINAGKVFYDTNALDWLAEGQSVTDRFTYAIRLGNGTLSWATVTVNLAGKNDGVAITSVAQRGAVAEDGVPSASGTIAFTDADLRDTHSATFVADSGNTTTLGAFSLNPVSEAADVADGSVGWSYALDNAAAQYLGAGQVVTESFVVTVSDGHGGTTTDTVTVTISGKNDGPTVTGGTYSGALVEDGTTSASGSIDFADVDLIDVHSVSFAANGSGYLGTFSAARTDDSTGDGTGQAGWTFSVDNSLIQYLAVGETLTQLYTVTISDGQGGTVQQVVTVTIAGTNDAPVIAVAAGDRASAALDETNAGLTASGTLTVSDADTSDLVDVAVSSVSVGGTGGTNSISNDALKAMLSLTGNSGNAANGTLGSLGWSFNSGSEAFNHLGAGETLVLTYTLSASDGHGGAGTRTVTVTVTGTNDAPVVAAALADVHSDEDTAFNFTLPAGSFTDVDSATLTYSARLSDGSALPDWLHFDAATRTFSGTPPLNFNGNFEVRVTASDGSLSVSDDFTLVIDPVNDAPVASGATGSTSEDSTFTGTLSATDVEGDALTFAVAPGQTLPAGVTLNSDGTFSVAPQASDQGLDDGESRVVTFSFVANDGAANSAPQTVSITVNGSNDAPVLSGPAATLAAGSEDTAYTVTRAQLLEGWTDVDGETLSISGLSASNGTVVANSDGSYTITPTLDFNGPVTLSYSVTDGTATVATTLGYTLGAVDDAPVNTLPAAFSTDEDTALRLGGLAVADVDAGAGAISVTLAVSGGTLAASATGDVSVSGSGTGSLVLTGTVAALNAYLASTGSQPTFSPAANANGDVTLTMTTSDNGFTGSGGPRSDVDTSTITIAPVNDAAVIGGTRTGSVTEATPSNAGTPTASGTLTATDVDNPANTFQAVTTAMASANGYGTFTLTAAGVWTYSLNNANPAVDALNSGQSLTDSFEVRSADGTAQTITVTINGATDFSYTPPPLSSAPDANDFDDLHAANTRGTLLIMAPGSGDTGANTYEGSNGNDTIYAGNGADEVYGHNGADSIYGENGADISLYGQRGDDFIYGGSGADRVYGGSGNDTIYGNANPDSGGDAGDTIYGGSGRDTIYGQDGNDVIIGGHGQDLLTGGVGSDRFVYLEAADTGDFIMDFTQGSDTVDLSALGLTASAFVGAVSGAGQVGAGQFGYLIHNPSGTGMVTTIYVDTDGVYGADLEITLVGNVPLNVGDFTLTA